MIKRLHLSIEYLYISHVFKILFSFLLYFFVEGRASIIVIFGSCSLVAAEFKAGLKQYFARDFPEASGSFSKVLKANTEDKVAALFLNKAGRYIHEGMPDGWEGVEEMRFK